MSLINNHTNYMNFWSDASAYHKLIKHDPYWRDLDANGTKECHFVRVIDSGANPFNPNYYLKEVIEQNRDQLTYPAVLAESLRTKYQKQGQITAAGHGALIVLIETGDKNNFDSINNAITQGELICQQMIGYLQQHLKANPNLGRLDWNSVIINPIGPVLDDVFGGRVDFEIEAPANSSFCFEESAWDLPG